MQDQINFFHEETDFRLKNSNAISQWIMDTIDSYKTSVDSINYIFCEDEYLHKINMEHLKHDTYTDIITFQYNDSEDPIESDIYISVERVKENANTFNVPFEQELNRVIIHGVLHLLGHQDKTEEQKKEMRIKEDYFLSLLPQN